MYHPDITVGVFVAALASIVGSRVFFTSSNWNAWVVGSVIAVGFCAASLYILPFIRIGGSSEEWTPELFSEIRRKVNGYVIYWLPYALPGLLGGLVLGGVVMATHGVIGVALRIVNPQRVEVRESNRSRFFSLTFLLGVILQVAVFLSLLKWLSRTYS